MKEAHPGVFLSPQPPLTTSHALRSIGRHHPLACLFIQSWENVEINEASIRQASNVWGWGGGGDRGSVPIQECLRKLQEPPAASESGGFPQTPFRSSLIRRPEAWEAGFIPTATHFRRPARCRRAGPPAPPHAQKEGRTPAPSFFLPGALPSAGEAGP